MPLYKQDIITDWVAYTPTLVGFGTVSGSTFYSRRVGSSLHIKGSFTTGTCTATEARLPIGFNGSSANVTINSTITGTGSVVGGGTGSTGAAFSQIAPIVTGANTYLCLGLQSAITSIQNAINGNALSNSSYVQFFAEVPISGWTA